LISALLCLITLWKQYESIVAKKTSNKRSPLIAQSITRNVFNVKETDPKEIQMFP